jgi:hypothetical protein
MLPMGSTHGRREVRRRERWECTALADIFVIR